MDTIHVKVTTLSNLFIGGSPQTFEIGGIDLFTVTDHDGKPFIPASSFKGSMRRIVREVAAGFGEAEMITRAYREYLHKKLKENMDRIEEMKNDDRFSRVKARYEEVIGNASAEYLFGIEGFNHTPKFMFNDLRLVDTGEYLDPFSIDSKNSIETSKPHEEPNVVANPRTYKTVRPGVQFTGEIYFYMLNQLSVPSDAIIRFVERVIDQFNTGLYRLGNSGSRGYGRVQIEVSQEGRTA